MGKVQADLTMSLDGYIAGPNDRPGNPLGDGGEKIHQWQRRTKSWRELIGLPGGENGQDNDVFAESIANVRAYVMGRRMFDAVEEPWGENPPFHMPVFVATHRGQESVSRNGGTTFHFVTEGVEAALARAKEAAGDADVKVSGGANVVQQLARAGLLDELQVHVSPIFLGGGVRLLDNLGPEVRLEPVHVLHSPFVTHIRYRFVK